MRVRAELKAFQKPHHPESVPRPFRAAVDECLARIPVGKVASCGAVATALGDVRAARSVAAWLVDHPDTPGAHRVVRADGRSLIEGATDLVAREGAPVARGRATPEAFCEITVDHPLLAELRDEQRRLASRVVEQDETATPRTLAGVDVAYVGDRAFAAAVVLDADTLGPVEVSVQELDVDFPYVPTYLAFREFPAIQAAMEGLGERPDLLFVDGHGRLHPALFGFACYAGVRLDLPTIGIAKHALVGRADPSAARVRGATPISMDGIVRGYAWTPPGASRPFYVSVGHRVSLPTALALAQSATRRRYPQPLLEADRRSKERKVGKNRESDASGPTVPRSPAQGRPGI